MLHHAPPTSQQQPPGTRSQILIPPSVPPLNSSAPGLDSNYRPNPMMDVSYSLASKADSSATIDNKMNMSYPVANSNAMSSLPTNMASLSLGIGKGTQPITSSHYNNVPSPNNNEKLNTSTSLSNSNDLGSSVHSSPNPVSSFPHPPTSSLANMPNTSVPASSSSFSSMLQNHHSQSPSPLTKADVLKNENSLTNQGVDSHSGLSQNTTISNLMQTNSSISSTPAPGMTHVKESISENASLEETAKTAPASSAEEMGHAPKTSIANLTATSLPAPGTVSTSSYISSSPLHNASSSLSPLSPSTPSNSMSPNMASSPRPYVPSAPGLGPLPTGPQKMTGAMPHTMPSGQVPPLGYGNLPSAPRMGIPGMVPPSMGPPGMAPPPPSMGPPGMAPLPSMGPPGMAPPPSMGPPGMAPPPPSMGPPGMAPPPPSMGPTLPSMGTPSVGLTSTIGSPGMAPPSSMSPQGMAPPSSMIPPPRPPSSLGTPVSMSQPGMTPPGLNMMPPPMSSIVPPSMPPPMGSGMKPPSFNMAGSPGMGSQSMQSPRMSIPPGSGMPSTFAPPLPPGTSASQVSSPLAPSSALPPPMSSFSPGMPPPPPTSGMSGGLPNASIPNQGSLYPPPMSAAQAQQGSIPPQSMHGGMQTRYPGSGPPSTAGSMPSYPQSQGRRLNPDDMPSPLQVMEEDQQARSGEFITNLKGAVPPLVTTDFFVRDGGNVSPHFLRSTMYSVPALPDMMKQSSVPFGLVLSPLAEKHPDEQPIYLGTSLTNGPIRCNRCKAYMSPLMLFMDGGRRFQCLLCKQINEVPADYFCHMDGQGARADKFHRPELCLGTYEFLATAEYCKEKTLPKEPAFIFVIEITQLMMQRGIVNFICQNMRSLLQDLPKEETTEENAKSKIHIGFITYDSSVHFYKMNGQAPEMCIVCDKNDMFVPVPDGVLCDIDQVSDNLDKLMNCIPQNFNSTRETSGALSGAIQAGMAALKASGRAGKLFIFHSSLPQVNDDGRLKNREDRKLLGTEKEKSILTPQNTHYNNLAQDLVKYGCGVDMYLFNDSYIDLATIGQVSRLTGGQCYKYSMFQLNKDGPRLLEDLRLNLKRNIAFDAMMRVRTSTGVRPVDFFGHFYMTNTHDIEFATVDSSKAVAIEIKHDDKITEEDGVYIQAALLYTSISGQRKLRIMNLALNVCTQMADLYKNCDLDTLMNFFSKQAMFKFLDITAKQVKENLINKSAQILACYRRNCATPSSAGQLILPELMKLLPLYVNCLSKCDALSGGQDLTCDDRSWHIYQLSTMNVSASVAYLYPRLIPLSEANVEETGIPAAVRTSYDKLRPDSVFLLENGLFMFMWVGSGTPSTWMNEVFGVTAPHQLDPVLAELPELDNPTSKRVRSIIDAVRKQRRLHLRLFVVPQQGKHEVVMRNYLIEDKGVFGSPSYVDFLCHVHKEIRSILS